MHALKGEVEVLKVADRCLAPVHSKAHLSLVTNLILVANGVSVNNFGLQIYALLSVKFSGIQMC